MSKPENKLNYYRSYSYHHVLIAANSTTVADAMNTSEFDFSRFFRKNPGRMAKDIEVQTLNNRTGQYVVILNTAQDTDFYIEDLTWTSIVIPSKKETKMSYTLGGLEGTMIITEPNGARFFNYLNDVFSLLKCDPIGINFILKTYFVGYPADNDGNTNPNKATVIESVSPLSFSLYDIVNEFDQSGARYTISFLGNVNGTAKLPSFSRIPTGGNFIQSNKLSDTMVNLEKVLNHQSKLAFDKHVADLRSSGQTDIRNRRVKYEIVLDDVYKKSKYVVDNFNGRESGTEPYKGVVVLSPDWTIEKAIDEIMYHCKQVLDEAAGVVDPSTGEKTKYLYKITSTINSTILEEPDANGEYGEYKLTFVIRRQQVIENSKTLEAKATEIGLTDETLATKTLEFDYIFTGKNVDIIEFDMTMDMGMQMFLMLKPRNNVLTLKEQLNSNADVNKKPIGVTPKDNFYETRSYSPIGPAISLGDSNKINHKPFSAEYTEFRSLLNTLATLSAIDCKVTIRGNPDLLNSYILTPGQATDENALANSIIGDWRSTPGLVKINIRMVNDDINGETFTEPFWYQGYYMIQEVVHKFSEGDFTQELQLIALPRGKDFQQLFEDTSADVKQEQEKKQPGSTTEDGKVS